MKTNGVLMILICETTVYTQPPRGRFLNKFQKGVVAARAVHRATRWEGAWQNPPSDKDPPSGIHEIQRPTWAN